MGIIVVGRSSPLKFSGSHIHDTWEIILNLEGDGTMTVGTESFRFTAGDVVCIPPRTPHSKMADDKFQDTYVQINRINFAASSHIKFLDSDNSVNHLLSLMHTVYHRKERNYQSITDNLVQVLEQLVFGRTGEKQLHSGTESIISMIVEHYSEPDFRISDILSSLGYCEDHARRIFFRETGMSPLEYLTGIRIEHAKKLLSENYRLHYTIAEVATASGYSDISYFSRVFKKHTGMSPRAYLNRYGSKSSEPSSSPACSYGKFGCGETY